MYCRCWRFLLQLRLVKELTVSAGGETTWPPDSIRLRLKAQATIFEYGHSNRCRNLLEMENALLWKFKSICVPRRNYAISVLANVMAFKIKSPISCRGMKNNDPILSCAFFFLLVMLHVQILGPECDRIDRTDKIKDAWLPVENALKDVYVRSAVEWEGVSLS